MQSVLNVFASSWSDRYNVKCGLDGAGKKQNKYAKNQRILFKNFKMITETIKCNYPKQF